jgi:thioesterase domain-containing protein
MLVPVQPSGTKPPLFFVHGMHGVMPLGASFAQALGPDQPLYAIHATGVDGRQPPIDDFEKMLRTYIGEIEQVRPAGPLRIGGMCTGCLVVIEIARALQGKGRRTGPLIMADPSPIPWGYDRRRQTVDPREPQVAQQLYRQAHRMLLDYASRPYNDLPFDPSDPSDPSQVHAATLAGVSSLIAFAKHVPSPFPGPAELIVSAEYASGFFHPQMPWSRLLPAPRTAHVLPLQHRELFRSGHEEVARLLKFMLERPPRLEAAAAAVGGKQASFA